LEPGRARKLLALTTVEMVAKDGDSPVWAGGKTSTPGQESGCLGLQSKAGGKLHLRLNTDERPIANKYREGKMKRTLKKELKVREIAGREAIGMAEPSVLFARRLADFGLAGLIAKLCAWTVAALWHVAAFAADSPERTDCAVLNDPS
jgi:hypothetical protein